MLYLLTLNEIKHNEGQFPSAQHRDRGKVPLVHGGVYEFQGVGLEMELLRAIQQRGTAHEHLGEKE